MDLVVGTPARLYPWGDEEPDGVTGGGLVPPPVPGGAAPFLPAEVGRYSPAGDGASGARDMAGNVWQWTSEFADAHTRSAVLRGGSSFRPQSQDQFNNNWYFPGGAPYDDAGNSVPWGTSGGWGNNKYPAALQLQTHAKLLLMAPSIDRAATVGFRCAADT